MICKTQITPLTFLRIKMDSNLHRQAMSSCVRCRCESIWGNVIVSKVVPWWREFMKQAANLTCDTCRGLGTRGTELVTEVAKAPKRESVICSEAMSVSRIWRSLCESVEFATNLHLNPPISIFGWSKVGMKHTFASRFKVWFPPKFYLSWRWRWGWHPCWYRCRRKQSRKRRWFTRWCPGEKSTVA